MKAEESKKELLEILSNFDHEIKTDNLRAKVLSLVECFEHLRNIGKSLLPPTITRSARERILHYFQKYPQIVISGDELLVISGIQEYARRVRELRVQFSWFIISGLTAKEMAEENELSLIQEVNISTMRPSDYILISTQQDREAAHRWNLANEIRKENLSVRDKILKYMRINVGKEITGEELKYLAKDRSEWARRIRELRTEYGWPIVTKNTGRPDLEIGIYLLEADRQAPEHDRRIPDSVKLNVLRRDNFACTKCNWSHKEWSRSLPRHLELHHEKEHSKGGENTEDNLITVCTVCHDEIHSRR